MGDEREQLSVVHVRELLPHSPGSPRAARDAIKDLLADSPDTSFVGDAMLAASEVVTNAVTHTTDGCLFEAWYSADEGVVRIAVTDNSPVVPVLRTGGRRDATCGRGLVLLDQVATRWGVEPVPPGKRVWFELRSGR